MLNSVSDIPFLQKKKYNESAFITKRVTNKYNMSFMNIERVTGRNG